MENIKIVAFKLGEEEFGLDIDHVHSIERISQITRVPNAPDYIKGVMNLRGQITPIIDLQNILSKNLAGTTDRTRIMIANYQDMNLGFMVDETSDVMDVKPDEIVPPSSNGLNFDYLNGIAQIGSRIIMLLNLDELMKLTNN
jgi:purine-binding chemotaxis protein CheW